MREGITYKYNFLGFPGGYGIYRGDAEQHGGPAGWFCWEVRDNSFDKTTHLVFSNPALLATILPHEEKVS